MCYGFISIQAPVKSVWAPYWSVQAHLGTMTTLYYISIWVPVKSVLAPYWSVQADYFRKQQNATYSTHFENVYWCCFTVWICWNWKHKINKWCELWYLLVKFYWSDRLLTSVILCVVPFNVTFIAPLVTAVIYVYVCNKIGTLRESVKVHIYKHVNNIINNTCYIN